MASPAADALTRDHRRDAARVTSAVERNVMSLARDADVSDVDAWLARNLLAILRMVAPGFAVLAEMTVRYLRRHAALSGVALDPVAAELDEEALTTSLRVTGPVAFKKHLVISGDPEASREVMAKQMSRSSGRHGLNGDRGSVMATFSERPVLVGYRRILNSPNPCAFCALLASRGAVYRSANPNVTGRGGAPRGVRQVGEAYHDSCSCTLEPLYEHEPEPADVVALRDRWDEVTAGLSGNDAINAYRRSLTSDPLSAEGATPEA